MSGQHKLVFGRLSALFMYQKIAEVINFDFVGIILDFINY